MTEWEVRLPMGDLTLETGPDTGSERRTAVVTPLRASTVGRTGAESGSTQGTAAVDLETESVALCHACGERKRFAGLICDACRRRHGV